MRSELKIDGMTCAACSGRIERVLAKTNGIEEINVNLTTETATVSFDQTLITNDEIDYTTSTVIHIKLKDFLLMNNLDNI